MAAGQQTGEGELVLGLLRPQDEAAVEDLLRPLPQLARHQRFMPAAVGLALPVEIPAVDLIAQDLVHGALLDGIAALAEGEPVVASHPGHLLDGVAAGDIPVEQLPDDRRHIRVRLDRAFAVGAEDVAIAERREGRPDALRRLLAHALARLLGQVVDVVLRHQHLDAVHELFRGARIAREHHTFLGEMDLDVEFVQRHPVLEVAVEPVGLLDQHHADRRMALEIGNHLAEGGAAGLLGGLHVHVFLRHREALRRGVFLQQLQLRRDREAFLLLLLGGDAGIDHRLLAGGIGGGCGLRCLGHMFSVNWTQSFCKRLVQGRLSDDSAVPSTAAPLGRNRRHLLRCRKAARPVVVDRLDHRDSITSAVWR